MSELKPKCEDCTRECTEKCQYHPDYWKPAAQRTAEFLLETFEPRACDCDAVSHCERCSVVATARWMLDKVLNTECEERSDLEAQLAEKQANYERVRKDRAILLDVKTTEGLSASEWMMRTYTAEAKLAEAEEELENVVNVALVIDGYPESTPNRAGAFVSTEPLPSQIVGYVVNTLKKTERQLAEAQAKVDKCIHYFELRNLGEPAQTLLKELKYA